MRKIISVLLVSFVLFISLVTFSFAGGNTPVYTPSVYGNVTPSSSVTAAVYGYVVNLTGKVPRSWVLIQTQQSVYSLYYSLTAEDLSDCSYVVYHQSYNYSGDIFTTGSLPGYRIDVLQLPKSFTYVGNVPGSCSYASDYSSGQFDYTFLVLCLISVLFIILLFRRGYPGKVTF